MGDELSVMFCNVPVRSIEGSPFLLMSPGIEKVNLISDCTPLVNCVFLTQPNGFKPDASPRYKQLFWMTPFNVDYTLPFDDLVHIAKTYNQALIQFSKDHRIPNIDLDRQIPPSTAAFHDDCHFNTDGSKLVGNALFQTLRHQFQSP